MSEDDLIVKKPPPVVRTDEELRPVGKGDAARAHRNRWRAEGRLRPAYRRLLVTLVFAFAGVSALTYFNRNFSEDVAAYVDHKIVLVKKWWSGER